MSGFISELKRRNVIRMAGLYLVGAWLLTQQYYFEVLTNVHYLLIGAK